MIIGFLKIKKNKAVISAIRSERERKMFNLVEWMENGRLHEELLDNAQFMELAFADSVEIISVKAV